MGKKISVIILTILGVALALFFYLQKPPKIISPIGQKTKVIKTQKQVIGFFPYWNLNKLTDTGFENLTKIYYFAVDLSADGSFNTNDPGWFHLNSAEFEKLKKFANNHNLRFGVTIVNLDQDSIAKNLNSPLRRNRIVKNYQDLMKTYGFTDLNLDLEYTGEFDSGLSTGFTSLVSEIKREIPHAQLSLDVMADEAQKHRLIDFKQIERSVDYVIVMGYDFNRQTSLRAGAVAPLPQVLESVNNYLSFFPAQKIVLGVPFYGYEWPTLDNQKNSWVIKSYRGPELSSYQRSLKTATDNNASINFDDDTSFALTV